MSVGVLAVNPLISILIQLHLPILTLILITPLTHTTLLTHFHTTLLPLTHTTLLIHFHTTHLIVEQASR